MSARVSAGGATTGGPIGVVTGAAAQAPRMSASVGSGASKPAASRSARVRTWPARVIQPWTWPGAPSTVATGNIWFQFARAPMRPSANWKAWFSCESRVLIMVVVLVISDAMPASWALEVIALWTRCPKAAMSKVGKPALALAASSRAAANALARVRRLRLDLVMVSSWKWNATGTRGAARARRK